MTLIWSFSLKLLVDSAMCVVGDYACVGTASVHVSCYRIHVIMRITKEYAPGTMT